LRKWRWISYSSSKIYDPKTVDELMLVSQTDPEEMARRLASEEGLFGGISAAGGRWVALRVAEQVRNAAVVFVICDRYLSTGVFPA
jgi:cysteine synthase B